MTRRGATTPDELAPLLDLLERRFALRLDASSPAHLREVTQHYRVKRDLLLREHGEAGALAHPDYAKAVLVSEAARLLILREIDPWPRKRVRKSLKDTR